MNTRGKKNERGASAVEYGLLIAAVTVTIMISVFAIGTSLGVVFYDACVDLNSGAACT